MDSPRPKSPQATTSTTTSTLRSVPQSSPGKNSNPPEHLSEFFLLINDSKLHPPLSPTRRPAAGDPNGYRRPSLHTLDTFTSFSPSVLDLPNILTPRDFEHTTKSYQAVLDKAHLLQQALEDVSRATGEFGQALEDSVKQNPKVHNTRAVFEGLQNAGGLQLLVSSNQQILGRLLGLSFAEPLQLELQKLRLDYHQNHLYYQQEIRARSRILRQKELQNLKLSKLKTRNLSDYRANLMELTRQVEEIDRLKYGYYHEINMMLERFNQEQLLSRTGSLVRAQLEIYEGIAKKGWLGGGLDDLLSISPDLFASKEDEETSEPGLNGADLEIDDNSSSDVAVHDDVTDGGHDTFGTIRMQSPETSTPLQGRAEVDESFDLPVVSTANSLIQREDDDDTGGEVNRLDSSTSV